VLFGDGGNDTMAGGAGTDAYFVDDIGDAVLEAAGQGIDIVFATIDYALTANVENLVLNAGTKGTGNDLANRILGSFSADTLTGGLGNDSLNGDLGADLLIGGKGNDLYSINDAGDTVTENPGEGTDTIRTSLVSFTLTSPAFANVENLTLLAGAFNGEGNDLANVITGNDGINDLRGAAGNDTMIGGKADDSYHVDSAGDKVVELAGIGSGIDAILASVSYTIAANVEFLNLIGAGAINGTGNASNNSISDVGSGDNKISGLQGNDSLFGGDGNDTLDGGAGNDILNDGTGVDNMAGGAGNDRYFVDDVGDKIVELAGQGLDAISTTLASFSLDTAALKDIEGLFLNVQGAGTGNALNNTIIGSAGNDTLTGGLGNDTLDGADGADLLIGGKGNDTYIFDNAGDKVTENPGEGTDTIRSSLPDIEIDGVLGNVENLILLDGASNASGNDLVNVMTGNAGNNSLIGGRGNDTMIGGKGNDTYLDAEARDKIVELAGANSGVDAVNAFTNYTLPANVEILNLQDGAVNGTGNAQDNLILGNIAANKLAGAAGNDDLRGEAGADTLDGGNGDDSLSGGDDNDKLLGGAGRDILNGGSGLDSIAGGAGDDNLDGSLGADTMLGGAGSDFYMVDDVGDTITELAGQGFDRIRTTLANFSRDTAALKNIELLALEVQGTGTGNALNNWLLGNSGNDTLFGGLGNDTLEGDFGADSMAGGKGNDFYIVDNAGDTVTENPGEGTDTVQSSLQSTSLAAPAFANVENLSLVINALNGTGNGLANVIAGNEKNNSLDGAAGNDTMIGGKGDDTYVVAEARDRIVELVGANSGFDVVNAFTNYTLSANVEVLNLLGGAFNGAGNAQGNGIFGNSVANKLAGAAGNDDLRGDAGADTLDGGNGNDSLSGGDDNDKLLGGAGNDDLNGEAGMDSMAGGAGNDRYLVDNAADQAIEASGQGTDLVIAFGDIGYTLGANIENLELLFGADGAGNALGNRIDGGGDFSGDNAMSGLGGNDTLIGGSGVDTMIGGAGRDTFALADIDGATEIITDFAAGKNGDRLDLSDLLTGFTAGSSNPSDFVQFGNAAGNTTVRVDADGAAGGANFVDVCLLQGVTLINVDQAATEGNLVLA